MKTYNVCFILKLLFFCICWNILANNDAAVAQENNRKQQLPFIPLTEFMETKGISDPENFIYVIDRCQANFVSLLKIFNSKGSSVKQQLNQQIEMFSLLLTDVIKKNNLNPDRIEGREFKIIEVMSKKYDEYWFNINLSGIDIAEDSLFQNDNKICSYISNKIKK